MPALLRLARRADLTQEELTEEIKSEIDRIVLYDVYMQLCSMNHVNPEMRFNNVTQNMLNTALSVNSKTINGINQTAIEKLKISFDKAIDDVKKSMHGNKF